MVSSTVKSLEIKEPYIVKTEMLKNSTHQSFRWVEVALSENAEVLKEWAKHNIHHSVEYRIKDRY